MDDNENMIRLEDFFLPTEDSFEEVELYIDAPWWLDNNDMHAKFGFHEAVAEMDPEKLRKMLEFRLRFLQEELDEAKSAQSAEDIVDAMIDLCVVAIGTLDAYNVDSQEAWSRVHDANMAKERGIKPERPNPLGLPDLVKPEGWVAPSHEGNHGLLAQVDYEKLRKEFE
jgi:predicted HAD superfamily Cof-like phosphohydrolase